MKIAVVGGGISGLTAAYLLSRQHQVELYEASPRFGGHTLTVEVEHEGGPLAVDLGFIVYNERTYPLFTRLLDELGVETQPTSMSFSMRCEESGIEYSGEGISGLFAQRRNVLRPKFWTMLGGIYRFHRAARRHLEKDEDGSLGAFLDRHRIPKTAVDLYVLPMTAAIWSTHPGRMLDFPARSLFRFLANHGLLKVTGKPTWRVVAGGSKRYLPPLVAPFERHARLGCPVEAVTREEDRVWVRPVGEEALAYDRVVLATHSDQALRLLHDPTPAEREVLGAIPYRDNDVILHTDRSVLPRSERAWASWNYHRTRHPKDRVEVTYSMNRLQHIASPRQHCVTLNRNDEIAPETVLRREVLAHPQFGEGSEEARERWSEIDGVRRAHFCGAYWGNGFHEDGVRSAVRVARALGVDW